jgi:hypothetical protein
VSAPRRRRPAADVDVRGFLLESMRARCERYRAVVDGDRSPWPCLVAQLEAGEPVTVHVYQLPREARAGLAPGGRVLVAADGTVSPAEWS